MTTAIRLVCVLVLGGLVVHAGYWCVALWRRESALRVLMPRMLAGIGRGDYDLARGHLRAFPVITAIGVVTVAAVLPGPVLLFTGGVPRWALAVTLAALPLDVILVALWACIVLCNRPRLLVPPHMRKDQGLLATRRARKRLP